MQNLLLPSSAASTVKPLLRRLPAAPACPNNCVGNSANQQFITMLNSYHATGGMARIEEVVELFESRRGPSSNVLSAWIQRRQVICFEWRLDTWLPWFQFHCTDLIPHPQLSAIFAELTSVFDPWEMASWFARPNPWLADRMPVGTLVEDLTAVLNAARADRFIANG
ncbi:MAG: hypothetical protein H7274_08735 [Rhodoferax sp.]|nr:hypothetical protein [Rhodoferax sp.]